jgi:hypothetical protein
VQLDQNRIVIRQRSFLDVMDLALRVIRAYAWPLIVAFACGVFPAMCFNAWLLADFATFDLELGYMPYMWLMLLLVIWEMPLATALLTLYLGQALFTTRPRTGDIGRGFARALPQMLWYQLVLRALFLPLVVTWFFPFAAWSFLSEVILLERTPMRRKRRGQLTTTRRRQALHIGYVSELFARWLVSMAVGSLLFLSFWLSLWLAGGMLLGEWAREGPTITLCYPLALWLVVGYFTVVRFLGYLDLRIRREGWEVELLLRA